MQSLTTSGEHVAPDIIPFIYYYYNLNEKRAMEEYIIPESNDDMS